MQAYVARGLAPAEAADAAKRDTSADVLADLSLASTATALQRLRNALDAYDGVNAERVIDRCIINLGLAEAIRRVLLPYLFELGRRWERGEASVALEHYASGVIRRRLLNLGDGWERGSGDVAVVACAPGEQHDIGLISFAICLHSYHGWRIKFLGADTPVGEIVRATRVLRPSAVVVSSVVSRSFFADRETWRSIADETTLAIAGAGATAALARQVKAAFLSGDPVTGAAQVASGA
jgi:methanogenic corrinoid protein MtbC1